MALVQFANAAGSIETKDVAFSKPILCKLLHPIIAPKPIVASDPPGIIFSAVSVSRT